MTKQKKDHVYVYTDLFFVMSVTAASVSAESNDAGKWNQEKEKWDSEKKTWDNEKNTWDKERKKWEEEKKKWDKNKKKETIMISG